MHERPVMPMNVPKELEELVRLCWSQTPEERPTFKTIYKLFRDKKVAYAGTDFAAVEACINEIEKAEEQLRIKKGLELPVFDDSILPVITEMNEYEDEDESLTNFESKLFGTRLVGTMKTIDVDDVTAILDEIVGLLPFLPTEKMEDVLVALRSMCNRGDEFVEVFRGHPIFEQLPFEKTDVFGTLYDLMFEIIDKNSYAFDVSVMQRLITAHPTCARELMSLLALMMKNEPREDVLDLLMNNWSMFLNKDAGVLMFSVLNGIVSEEFEKRYARQYSELLSAAFESSNRRLLNAAYKLLSNHFNEKYVPKHLVKHLRSRKTAHAAMVVLSMCKSVVLTEQHLVGLFGIAQYKEASAMILNAASKFEYAQMIVSNAASWVSTNKMDDETLLVLMLRLTRHRNLEMNDATLLKFCFFLDRCLAMRPIPFGIICAILRQMPNTKTTATFCESCGFIGRYLNAAVEAREWQAAASFVETLCKFGFSESFKIWLDKISGIDFESDPSSLPAICDLVTEVKELNRYVEFLGSENAIVNAVKRNHGLSPSVSPTEISY